MHCDVAKQILLSYDTLQLCLSCGGFITVDCQWRWLLLNHSINDSNYGPTHLPLLAAQMNICTHSYIRSSFGDQSYVSMVKMPEH